MWTENKCCILLFYFKISVEEMFAKIYFELSSYMFSTILYNDYTTQTLYIVWIKKAEKPKKCFICLYLTYSRFDKNTREPNWTIIKRFKFCTKFKKVSFLVSIFVFESYILCDIRHIYIHTLTCESKEGESILVGWNFPISILYKKGLSFFNIFRDGQIKKAKQGDRKCCLCLRGDESCFHKHKGGGKLVFWIWRPMCVYGERDTQNG